MISSIRDFLSFKMLQVHEKYDPKRWGGADMEIVLEN